MKKAVLLSFLIIVFISVKSFAQEKKKKVEVSDESTISVSHPVLNIGNSELEFAPATEYSWSFEDINNSADKAVLTKLKTALEGGYGARISKKLLEKNVLSFKIIFEKTITYSELIVKLNEIGVEKVRRNGNLNEVK